MLPVAVDLARVPVALVGNGALAARRLAQLDDAGARRLVVFSANPGPGLREAAGDRLVPRLPGREDLAGVPIVYIADLDAGRAAAVAGLARSMGSLVNVEDVLPLSDFHTPATVRRGDLVIAVSTGGKSPGLAGRLRRHLDRLLAGDWGARLDELAGARQRWRREGADMATVARRTDELIDRRGWL